MTVAIDACPTPWGTPIAIAECPHCGGAIGVSLRARPAIALPAGPTLPPPPAPSCCRCPHCGELVYPALAAVGPIAMAPQRAATALVPRDAPGPPDRRLAPTQRITPTGQ